MARILLLLAYWTFHAHGTRLARARTPNRKTNHTLDCNGWGLGKDACAKCEASETDLVGALIFLLTCRACSEGHVLKGLEIPDWVRIPGTNHDAFWNNECIPLIGEERHLIMIRHGESLWNEIMQETGKAAGIVGLWVGEDSPLSPRGLRQAQRLALVLKKTANEIYGVRELSTNITQSDGFLKLVAARSELEITQVSDALRITERASGRLISDEELVDNLARKENREDVDVLLGKKCAETNFVSSQLARAMDTLLIATIQSRLECPAPWFISSNLQEIEHNSDCTPKTEPHHQPEMAESQKKSYFMTNIFRTQEYVEARYQKSDVSRYEKNFGTLERARWNDQSPQMHDELDAMFASTGKKYNVWGGHSIWFRHFFQEFADLSSPLCKQLQEIKMANTAMVSLRLRRVDPKVAPGMGYAAYDCKWLHLGDDEDFKLKLDNDVLPRLMVPDPKDFDNGVQQIFGWKCCCSRSDYKDASVWVRARRSLEKCVLVKTDHCSKRSTWEDVWKQDVSFMETARKYDWGYNKGPCTA